MLCIYYNSKYSECQYFHSKYSEFSVLHKKDGDFLNTLHKIMDLMWKKGISEANLCNAAGINKSAVTDWKKGKTKSYIKHIDKIAEVLGVTKEYLLDDNSEKTAPVEQSLTDKQGQVLSLAKNLSDEDMQKLIDYAELLTKAKNQ